MQLQQVKNLIAKDILLEWRQKYSFNGMLLYVGCTVFVTYLSFNLKASSLGNVTWNTLFWIIMLFVGVNAVAKSFIQEREGRILYYYELASPEAIIVAKIIYNVLIMCLLGLVGLGLYSLVLGNPVIDNMLFIVNLLLASVGFSSTLTLISAIASKTQNGTTLMAVLSFPVIIPLLLMAIRISNNALDGLDRSASTGSLIILVAINVIVISLSLILFPYLWRS